jgi:hypothetical protein
LPEYSGWAVKTLGDEIICAFEDPNHAVEAACRMQLEIESMPPAEQRLAMHMGLNYGSVLVESGDVFGDSVNAASHLCAAASAGQILIAEQTAKALTGTTRSRVQPLFLAVLKGNTEESAVYRVNWQADTSTLTDVNLRRHNRIPPDLGSMLIEFEGRRVRIDPRHPTLALGRDASCDLMVDDAFASRRHAVLSLRRTQIYLTDQSTNGTFVRRRDGAVAHVFRSELMLDGDGEISLGRAFDQGRVQPIRFKRDRRALYRA